jgi:hypothetical protein
VDTDSFIQVGPYSFRDSAFETSAKKGVTAMPGPQSLTPKPVSPSATTRRFTVEQANKTLPLVRRVVTDIVQAHEQVAELQQLLEAAKQGQQLPLQDRLQTQLAHLQDYVDELTEIGCELKDYRLGLIDFIGHYEGRDICLCWKLGEEAVGYWHELNTGFSGRHPVSQLLEKD